MLIFRQTSFQFCTPPLENSAIRITVTSIAMTERFFRVVFLFINVDIYHFPVKLTGTLFSFAPLAPAPPTLNGNNAYQQKYTEYKESPHFES